MATETAATGRSERERGDWSALRLDVLGKRPTDDEDAHGGTPGGGGTPATSRNSSMRSSLGGSSEQLLLRRSSSGGGRLLAPCLKASSYSNVSWTRASASSRSRVASPPRNSSLRASASSPDSPGLEDLDGSGSQYGPGYWGQGHSSRRSNNRSSSSFNSSSRSLNRASFNSSMLSNVSRNSCSLRSSGYFGDSSSSLLFGESNSSLLRSSQNPLSVSVTSSSGLGLGGSSRRNMMNHNSMSSLTSKNSRHDSLSSLMSNTSHTSWCSSGVLQGILNDNEGGEVSAAELAAVIDDIETPEERARRLSSMDNMVPFYPPEKLQEDKEGGAAGHKSKGIKKMFPPGWRGRLMAEEDRPLGDLQEAHMTPRRPRDAPPGRKNSTSKSLLGSGRSLLRWPSQDLQEPEAAPRRPPREISGRKGSSVSLVRRPSQGIPSERRDSDGETPTVEEGEEKHPWWRGKRLIVVAVLGFVIALALAVAFALFEKDQDNNGSSSSAEAPAEVPSDANESALEDRLRERTGRPSLGPPSIPSPGPSGADEPRVCLTLGESNLVAGCGNGMDCNPIVKLHGDVAVISKREDHIQLLSRGEGYQVLYSEVDEKLAIADIAVSDGCVAIASSGEGLGTAGSVHLFRKDATSRRWSRSAVLVPEDLPAGAEFGVAVDAEKDIIVVGAPSYVQGDVDGSAYVFHRDENGTWVQDARLQVVEVESENSTLTRRRGFGRSLSVLGDLVAVADSTYDEGKGAVFVYHQNQAADDVTGKTQTSWTQLGDAIVEDDCNGKFGSSVVLMREGFLAGCPENGAIYYYEGTETGYAFRQKVAVSSPAYAVREKLGEHGQLAVDGSNMVVGTPSSSEGRVHVFALVNELWVEAAMIEAVPGNTYFGNRVAISGNTILVSSKEGVYSHSLDDCSSSVNIIGSDNSPEYDVPTLPPVTPSSAANHHETPQPASSNLNNPREMLAMMTSSSQNSAPTVPQPVDKPADALRVASENSTVSSAQPSMVTPAAASASAPSLSARPVSEQTTRNPAKAERLPVPDYVLPTPGQPTAMPSGVPSLPPTSIQYLSTSCSSVADNNTRVHLPKLCVVLITSEAPWEVTEMTIGPISNIRHH